jgi:hypothetical protein
LLTNFSISSFNCSRILLFGYSTPSRVLFPGS